MSTISRKEWRWAIAWSITLSLLLNLPYLYGAALSTPASQFGGFVIGIEDGNSYLAKMQQGRSGYWLFQSVYTPEPHQGALFFIFYILLGKLAALVGLSNVLFFHLSKIFTVPFALLAFYYFSAYFTERVKIRRLAFLIFGVTGGLGWLWLTLGGPAQLGQMPVDLWVPDASFFLAALTYPHLPLAQGLLLLLTVTSLEFLHTGQKRLGLAAATCGLAVSLIHPYTLPIISLILGVYHLWRYYLQPKQLFLGAGRLLLIALPAIPYLIYVLVVFYSNPVFVAWREQSLTYSPAPIHYLLGFGLTLLLALIGLWAARNGVQQYTFLFIWVILIPPLLYAPFALQRRFLDGYQAPLAVLAAAGLVWLVEKINSRRWQGIATSILLVVMSLTNILLLSVAAIGISQRAAPLFIAGDELAAAQWLADHTQGETILAIYETGNKLPTYANLRTFVGHGPETVNSDQKSEQVRHFFSTAADDEWRIALLQAFNISYLFYGPHEKAAGDFSPADASYLREVYSGHEVQIFRVDVPQVTEQD